MQVRGVYRKGAEEAQSVWNVAEGCGSTMEVQATFWKWSGGNWSARTNAGRNRSEALGLGMSGDEWNRGGSCYLPL